MHKTDLVSLRNLRDKSLILRISHNIRNWRNKEVVKDIIKYCGGEILDIGGGDFYLAIKNQKAVFNTWTVLEYSKQELPDITDNRYRSILGDGCDIPFKNSCFDIVLNIQVLEHVLHPIKMVNEIARVMKPGGYGIFLIPQTIVMHMAPYHYYNFTRFWIKEVMTGAGFTILKLKPLGGVWSSMASHFALFFFQSIRVKGMSTAECKRNALFYLFYPLMALYALLSIPVCLFLSLGDLSEEPNNYLVVVSKK
ncbi:MAG: class I SAM-dependent methyltransferase [Candidatus Omnitrophota bacterium]